MKDEKRFREAKKSTPPKGTSCTYTKTTYQISIFRLNVLGGGIYMQGTNSKIKGKLKKQRFRGYGGGAMRLKSSNPKKTHLEPLPTLCIKFQLPSSIWRRVIRRTKSKYKKTRPKNIVVPLQGLRSVCVCVRVIGLKY